MPDLGRARAAVGRAARGGDARRARRGRRPAAGGRGLFRGTAHALEAARVATDLGIAAAPARGSASLARETLARGADAAVACGAIATARRARPELVALGARPRRLRLRGVDALTPSELRVASLAAAGLSNRQIAQELFVSPKTVESHLGQVYGKLEVPGRNGLAAALATAPARRGGAARPAARRPSPAQPSNPSSRSSASDHAPGPAARCWGSAVGVPPASCRHRGAAAACTAHRGSTLVFARLTGKQKSGGVSPMCSTAA